ncbi:MAG: DUF721 domain-containing protein [Elusimicrobia bacterium]|nr:DUF721 domain-containing protein [Elusimicrobiota bacterium]
MRELSRICQSFQENIQRLNLVFNVWNENLKDRYPVDEFAFSKGRLIIFTDSGIVKKEIEMKQRQILKKLNTKLPGRKFVKEIKVRLKSGRRT